MGEGSTRAYGYVDNSKSPRDLPFVTGPTSFQKVSVGLVCYALFAQKP